MKIIAKILSYLLLLYILFWVGIATYFSFAARHKALLETNLSSLFQRSVTIAQVRTDWNGLSPIIQVNGFRVAGDTPELAAMAFASLSAEFSPVSMLRLWPQLTKFAVEKPSLEIVSLPSNQLQIAGITIGSNRSSGIHPKRLISWLLNHESAVWLDGEIIWRRLNGKQQRYSNISFVYQRNGDNRQINAATQTSKGPFAFKAQTNGNVLEEGDWNASFEVLGDQGQSLLAPEDLSLVVENGNGSLQLKTLDIQRIQDFLLITGLGEAASWVLDSQLAGRLHDVRFDFSGPLLEFVDWSLTALASGVNFTATRGTPGMSNLAGKVNASSAGGTFEFSASSALFEWPRWFDRSFPIDQAAGRFHWSLAKSGEVEIILENGLFADGVAKIWDLNASCSIDTKSRSVSNLGQLFTSESVADLSFEKGKLVKPKPADSYSQGPLQLRADTKFEIKSLPEIVRYFPNDPRIDKFRTWWAEGFLGGSANSGVLRYTGEVSKNAIKVGKAQLFGEADFEAVEIDYGYQLGWPKLMHSKGQATLENDLITILPDEAWLEDDWVYDSKVTIDSLFNRERRLDLQASMVTSLPRVMNFLFDGPLIKPEQRGRPMPITAQSGQVAAQVNVSIPLQNVRRTSVRGTAEVTEGHFILPQGVPVSEVSAQVNFTERSAESENIRANFLDGNARAKLITTEAAQPPKMKVTATGSGDIKRLQPWIGEHILSWLDGTTDWQGAVEIDGPKAKITAVSDLRGITVTAPEPLSKTAKQADLFSLSMQVGGQNVPQSLAIEYGSNLRARFAGDLNAANSLFDSSMIRLSEENGLTEIELQTGINFSVDYTQLDLDSWLAAVIDLAKLETAPLEEPNTAFLDAMRSVKISANDPLFLGRQFGAIDLSAVSVDGAYWIGSINGDNVGGTLQAEPRRGVGNYRFNLSRLHISEAPNSLLPPDPIEILLQPRKYPTIELLVNSFRLFDKSLGRLEVVGATVGEVWKLSKFELSERGIRTKASGQWANNTASGSLSTFTIETTIDEAGEVLDDMDFNDIIKKGSGSLNANVNWLGAPHEFDFARLNGDFDLRISDGELVKVEAGSGKLLGLFNFNAIARRLTLDFRDVFSSGLQFDRMQYSGVLANGEALLRDAYMLTPSVFVQMEGKLDLRKELIDMEIHANPQLGGNLTLLSALANPAAGAVVFLTQQIFKDQMRSSSFKSYRALGTWDDFELVEFDGKQSQPGEPIGTEPATVRSSEPLADNGKKARNGRDDHAGEAIDSSEMSSTGVDHSVPQPSEQQFEPEGNP